MTKVLMASLGAVVLLVGCAQAPGQRASGGEGSGEWSYAKGPHGENCLFYKYTKYTLSGDVSQGITMSCDSVKP